MISLLSLLIISLSNPFRGEDSVINISSAYNSTDLIFSPVNSPDSRDFLIRNFIMPINPAARQRLNELREQLEDKNGSAHADEESLARLSHQFCGRRIVTNDLNRAEESRIAISNLSPHQFQRPPRIYFQGQSDKSRDIYGFVGQPQSRLLTLPAELRIRIIEEALRTNEQYSVTNPADSWIQSPGIPLVFTCKQLHVEGMPTAVKNFTVKESDLPSYTHLCFRGARLPVENEGYG